MSTIVGIMDRAGFESNTDNLVLVEPTRQRLLWIPRDLWCPAMGDRINAAFRRGGHERLCAALGEHGLQAGHSIVLSRAATEAALAGVSVLVPVPARMVFDYPLTPTSRIEDGRKPIAFEPPAERLHGERIHQWLGARGGSDLHRIERQKVFLRRLIQRRFPFHQCLSRPEWFRCSDPVAVDELATVRESWRFDTLGALEPEVIEGKQVMVRT